MSEKEDNQRNVKSHTCNNQFFLQLRELNFDKTLCVMEQNCHEEVEDDSYEIKQTLKAIELSKLKIIFKIYFILHIHNFCLNVCMQNVCACCPQTPVENIGICRPGVTEKPCGWEELTPVI